MAPPRRSQKIIFSLAFCSYLSQILIKVILTCKVGIQIALDAISEHLKFNFFFFGGGGGGGGRPPRKYLSFEHFMFTSVK